MIGYIHKQAFPTLQSKWSHSKTAVKGIANNFEKMFDEMNRNQITTGKKT